MGAGAFLRLRTAAASVALPGLDGHESVLRVSASVAAGGRTVNVPAIAAMLPAIVIGTVGAGSINWFGHHYWLLPGPLSWVSAGAVYLTGMALVARSPRALTLAGFSKQAAASPTARSAHIEDLATLSAPQLAPVAATAS